MTPREQAYFNREYAWPKGKSSADPKRRHQLSIHAIWHDFQRRFYRTKFGRGWKKSKNGTLVRTKREYLVPDSYAPTHERFRWYGYDLMQRIEKWAAQFPHDVRVVGCDDSYHSGSDLVLIEHRTRDQYMGTTVVYLPQCSGDPPAQFFLYPGHRDDLVCALQSVRAASRPVERAQQATERRKRAFWARSRP
jgi:hypothetical protein